MYLYRSAIYVRLAEASKDEVTTRQQESNMADDLI